MPSLRSSEKQNANILPQKKQQPQIGATGSCTSTSEVVESKMGNSSTSSIIFSCVYCPLRAWSKDVIYHHWKKVHTPKKTDSDTEQVLPFQYKEVNLDVHCRRKEEGVCKKLSCKCFYYKIWCKVEKEKGTAHDEGTDPDEQLQVKQYIVRELYCCTECRFSAIYLSAMCHHFSEKHKFKESQDTVYSTVVSFSSKNSEVDPEHSLPSSIEPKQKLLIASNEPLPAPSAEKKFLHKKMHKKIDDKQQSHLRYSSKKILKKSIAKNKFCHKMVKQMYRCPKCSFVSSKYRNVNEHLRRHFKPIVCGHCSQRYPYVNIVRQHHIKAHPGMTEMIVTDEKVEQEMLSFKSKIITYKKKVRFSNILNSTGSLCHQEPQKLKTLRDVDHKYDAASANKCKSLELNCNSVNLSSHDLESKLGEQPTELLDNVINASGSKFSAELQGYSFYGTRSTPVDMSHLTITTIFGNEDEVKMDLATLSQIVDFNPVVKLQNLKWCIDTK